MNGWCVFGSEQFLLLQYAYALSLCVYILRHTSNWFERLYNCIHNTMPVTSMRNHKLNTETPYEYDRKVLLSQWGFCALILLNTLRTKHFGAKKYFAITINHLIAYQVRIDRLMHMVPGINRQIWEWIFQTTPIHNTTQPVVNYCQSLKYE